MDSGLERAIEAAGGPGALATLLGTTVQVVSNWRRRGTVPPERCRAIETALDGKVTASDLRPDIFGPPPPEPGRAAA